MEFEPCRDLIPHYPAYVAGMAPASVDLRIRAHLAACCGPCSVELESLQAAFQVVPLALGPRALLDGSAPLIARTVAKKPQELVEQPFPETDQSRLLVLLLVLACVALVVAAFWGRLQDREVDALKTELASSERRTRLVSGDSRDLRERADAIERHLEALTDPDVSSHDFPPAASGAHLRAFFAPGAGKLHAVPQDFGSPPAGSTHALWWGQAGEWSLLGQLDTRPRTSGTQDFELPEGAALPGSLRVTLEAARPEPPQAPGGDVVLEGELVAGQAWASPGGASP